MPRTLISDNGVIRVYEHTTPGGQVTGTSTEVIETPAMAAAAAQDASMNQLLSQAQTLLDSLATRRQAIVTAGQTLTTARNAKASAQTTYLALGTPTLAQVDTFLTAYIPYVTALDTAIVQNGTDAVADIDDLSAVVRRLGNLVAKLIGSTTVIS